MSHKSKRKMKKEKKDEEMVTVESFRMIDLIFDDRISHLHTHIYVFVRSNKTRIGRKRAELPILDQISTLFYCYITYYRP